MKKLIVLFALLSTQGYGQVVLIFEENPIGVGAGQAQVLSAPRATKYIDTEGNAIRAANKQIAEEQKAAFNKIMDFDFDLGWQIHDNQIQEQIDNFRNKVVGWYKEGGDMKDSDFQRAVKAEQDRIGLMARKSIEVKEIFEEERKRLDDPRYNDQARDNLNNIVFDGNGKAKNVWNIDRQQFIDNAKESSGYNKPVVCNSLPKHYKSYTVARKAILNSSGWKISEHNPTSESSWMRGAKYRSCDGVVGYMLYDTKSGKSYIHEGVPYSVWKDFNSAKSKGTFYNYNIKGKYHVAIR